MRPVQYILLALLIVSCGSKKKLTSSETRQEVKTVSTVKTESHRETATEIYGDTLKGETLIPVLTEEPINVPVESNGIKLNLQLQKGKLSYKVIAKPVGNEVEKESNKSTGTTELQGSSSSSNETELERKSKGLPWWFWVGLIFTGLYFLWKYTRLSTWIKIVIQKFIK